MQGFISDTISTRRNLLYVHDLAFADAANVGNSVAVGKTFLVYDGEGLATFDRIRWISASQGMNNRLFSLSR